MKTTLLPLAVLILSARALADPVTLEWDRNPEPDVVEYRVYLSDEKGVYGAPAQTLKTTASAPAPTQATVDLPKDVLHYSVVTAVNALGLESAPSDELVFRLGTTPPAKPGNLRIKINLNATLQISRDLEQWVDRGSVNSDNLFFRLVTATPGATAGPENK